MWHLYFQNGILGRFLAEYTFERTVIKKPLKMDINNKFQLTQLYFDSQGGFLTKSTFEIIMAYFHPLQCHSGSE